MQKAIFNQGLDGLRIQLGHRPGGSARTPLPSDLAGAALLLAELSPTDDGPFRFQANAFAHRVLAVAFLAVVAVGHVEVDVLAGFA